MPSPGLCRHYTHKRTQRHTHRGGEGWIIFFKRRKDSSVGSLFHLCPSFGCLDRQPGLDLLGNLLYGVALLAFCLICMILRPGDGLDSGLSAGQASGWKLKHM